MTKFIILLACTSIGFLQKTFAQENQSLSTSERKELSVQLQNSLDKFNATIAGLSFNQLNFREKDKKWTIAECIEHVTLAELKFPIIVADEMQKPSHPEFRRKIKIKDEKIRPKMLSRIWKAKSPEVFRPTGRFASSEEAIKTFQEQRVKTLEYVNTTTDDLRNHFWKHPLTGTIDLYQTLILMSAHLERHLEQMEKIKAASNFPTL
jgi:DinB superfamily